jgi:hypothetical protein
VEARRIAAEVFRRLRGDVGHAAAPAPATLPVCRELGPALALAGGERAGVAAALGAVAPRLVWTRRASAEPSDTGFRDGHANATIIGRGGLEERGDVWVGATLMAPGVVYPDHDHAPEEVYLSLTPGEWWNAETDWTDPGPEGLFHNPPGIRHAMRSGDVPFLALWLLPVG